MPTFYPMHVVDHIQSLIDDARSGAKAPMTAFQDIMDKCTEEQICYKRVLHTDEVMVHPANRGGLGLNAHNAHRTGAMIKSIGVDPEELAKSVAFEAMPMEPSRSEQLAMNQRLVDTSKGLLSPLTGREKYCSVGGGHCTAFFRAARANCSTPQRELEDTHGKISMERLSTEDSRRKTAFTTGWPWLVFPWQAEAQWPQLPDLAQRALNASQNVASLMSELEVCCTIAEFDEFRDANTSFDNCVSAVAMNQPPCKVCVCSSSRSSSSRSSSSILL